ncbi:glycosyltransferase [Vibrio cholerae]
MLKRLCQVNGGSDIKFLMSVYHKDSPSAFKEALDSLVNSVVSPDEVVLVEDGPLGDELQSVISSYSNKLPVKNVKLANNVGLGKALSIGLRECSYEWVARFDSDDIFHPARFQTQVAFIQQHESIDIIGTAIAEFESSKNDIHAYRKPPINHDEVVITDVDNLADFSHAIERFFRKKL